MSEEKWGERHRAGSIDVLPFIIVICLAIFACAVWRVLTPKDQVNHITQCLDRCENVCKDTSKCIAICTED